VYTFTKLHDRRLTNVGVGPVEFQLYATPTFLSLDLPPSSGLAYLSLHYPVYGLQAGASIKESMGSCGIYTAAVTGLPIKIGWFITFVSQHRSLDRRIERCR